MRVAGFRKSRYVVRKSKMSIKNEAIVRTECTVSSEQELVLSLEGRKATETVDDSKYWCRSNSQQLIHSTRDRTKWNKIMKASNSKGH